MLEVMIEQWSNRDGTTDYMWSVWNDGRRVQIGGPLGSAEDAEEEAYTFCLSDLKTRPDAVTRL